MHRRRVAKSRQQEESAIDPFGLNFDPEQLKFDNAALEKELVAMLGTDAYEVPESEGSVPSQKAESSSDDDIDLQQLQSNLKINDGTNVSEPLPIYTSSFPDNGVLDAHMNATYSVIKERQTAFENIIASMKSSTLTDVDQACLHRYERLLASVRVMADRARSGIPVDLHELPPNPPPFTPPSGQTSRALRRKTGQDIVLDYVTGESPKSAQSQRAESLRQLKMRLTEYRNAAALANKEGLKARESELMVAINAMSAAIPQIESGAEDFDPADMPPSPENFSLPPEARADEGVLHDPPAATSSPPKPEPIDPAVLAITKVASSTVANKDSLTARIQLLEAMIKSSDSSKRRVYERTLKRYNEALRAFQAGVRYDYGGLPILPNCPQFTSVGSHPPPSASVSVAPGPAGTVSSCQSKKLELLQKRQTELRVAAARAKSRGDMTAAREYLRSSLGLNGMIRSVNAGLPIDLKQLPPAPGAAISTSIANPQQKQPILSGITCEPPVDFQTDLMKIENDPKAICDRLIAQLESQAKEAEILSKDHREAGLSNLADKFLDLADVSHKWIAFTTAYQSRSRVPQYFFEQANLSRLNMNPDLGDEILEVTVVRGISLPVPQGINGPTGLDTYVTLELPFPSSDSPQKHSTDWARHTNEPTDYGGYQASARFEVNRKARSFERLLEGIKSLKATVYYNRGLLKRPGILGTVTVKLNELMSNATHIGCYSLMDGRKAAGGLLELRLRHRSPLHGEKLTAYRKPWLCISTSKKNTIPRKVN